MRIGIFFTMRKVNGGAYQYAMTMIEVLTKNPDHEYVIYNLSPDLPDGFRHLSNVEVLNFPESNPKSNYGLSTPAANQSLNSDFNPSTSSGIKIWLKLNLHNLLLRLHLFSLLKRLTRISQKNTIALVESKHLDLVIFTMTHKLAFLLNTPTIVPIHDLQHRLNPQFPEVSAGKIWAQREYLFSQIAKNAAVILVDSEVGKEDVVSCYHPNPKKIVILPFLPPNYLHENISAEDINNFAKKHDLPERFIFYPAQFWPHKNHANLIRAIGLLKQSGSVVNLVLTGAKKEQWGTWNEVEMLINQYGLSSQVRYLGYVDNDEIAILYKQAVAMVMPTFLGPTNIPVYEAWKMSCPVLYSNVRGCREQAGDAALLFDPSQPEDMAEKIKQIWDSETLRQDLIAKGKKRLEKWTERDFSDKINEVIKSFEVNNE